MIERIFFGFFQHSKFTALAVPKADGFNGSHDVHMHMHMHVHTRMRPPHGRLGS